MNVTTDTDSSEHGSHDTSVQHAVAHLQRGGVLAFPTETVYGLGVRAADEAAVERVFAMKGRPASAPMAVLVKDVAMARQCSSAWPADAQSLARAFWPGSLTLVVPAADALCSRICAGGATVGVRCPNHALIQQILDVLGEPIVGTSANRTGDPALTAGRDVRAAFAQVPDDQLVILEDDARVQGLASTVYDVAERTVLRQGAIDIDAIRAVLAQDQSAYRSE